MPPPIPIIAETSPINKGEIRNKDLGIFIFCSLVLVPINICIETKDAMPANRSVKTLNEE